MRNIILVCNAGMTTALLTNAMRKAAAKENYECEIHAYGVRAAAKQIREADIVLIGPQISFELPQLKIDFPDTNFMEVNTEDYGLMRGAKVLHQVQKALGDSE
jgi:PTS system cellobiose-specific IIB component